MKLVSYRVASSLIVGLFLIQLSTTAHAGWGSLGGSFGSDGGGSSGGSSGYATSYGSYGSSGGFASGGSNGSVGAPFTPVRSFFRGIHDHIAAKAERHRGRRAAYASYGSVGFSSVGNGSGGYSSVGYGSTGYSAGYGSTGTVSYGSTGSDISYGSLGSAVSYGSVGSAIPSDSFSSTEGALYSGASRASHPASSLISAVQYTEDDAVYLTVSLPASGTVLVNGKTTSSTGSVRQFVSRGLVPGKSYKFEVRAELEDADGQVLTEERTVVVNAGSQEQLQFAFAELTSPVETSLTLNVPEGAKVFLAGNPTRATGSQRSYQSKQLSLGQFWDDYTVEVELGGQVKRQSIRLIGGDSLELTFNFDEQPVDQIAAKR